MSKFKITKFPKGLSAEFINEQLGFTHIATSYPGFLTSISLVIVQILNEDFYYWIQDHSNYGYIFTNTYHNAKENGSSISVASAMDVDSGIRYIKAIESRLGKLLCA